MKTKDEEMNLQVWQEIIGDCTRFVATRDQVEILLRAYDHDVRIAFKRNSKEGNILRRLGRKLVGQKLGILKTDNETQPIVIRIIPKEKSAR